MHLFLFCVSICLSGDLPVWLLGVFVFDLCLSLREFVFLI